MFNGPLHYKCVDWRAILLAHLATNHEVMTARGPQFASPSPADVTMLIPSNNLTATHLVVFLLHAALLLRS